MPLNQASQVAGGLVWKSDSAGQIMIALIRRARERNWSFPKGKLRRRESARNAALREVREETGFVCRCQDLLGTVVYSSRRGRPKLATYWTMRPQPGHFARSAEVSELTWVGIDEARAVLDHERDLALLHLFLSRLELDHQAGS